MPTQPVLGQLLLLADKECIHQKLFTDVHDFCCWAWSHLYHWFTGMDGGDELDSESGPKKRRTGSSDQSADPSATLEPNTENLNVKKFDLTFAVDPLFHKTSAQFDEGGAKGMGCCIIVVTHGILHNVPHLLVVPMTVAPALVECSVQVVLPHDGCCNLASVWAFACLLVDL